MVVVGPNWAFLLLAVSTDRTTRNWIVKRHSLGKWAKWAAR